MKKRIVYIISDIDRAVGFEEIYSNLKDQFDFTFILLNKTDSYHEKYCLANNIPCYRVYYSGKKNLITATIKVFSLLKKIKPNIVHTHLFDASIIGLTAAKYAGIKKRVHTRHHSDYHHTYFPHAVKYDKYINKNSLKIIAVSPSVKTILIEQEAVSKEKITTIYHAFKINEYVDINSLRVNELKEKYNPANNGPVIGVISRYTEWKGIQYIIPAFKELLKEYPNALLILANAQGSYKKEITTLLNELPKENYTEVVFETDLHALYKLFTVFVHVPITKSAEAFGQVYIEALLSKVPSVFTKSGIASEFSNKKDICKFINYENSKEIYDSIVDTLQNEKETLKRISNGYEYAAMNFNLPHQMSEYKKFYDSL